MRIPTDCGSCGACCLFPHEDFLPLTNHDLSLLGPQRANDWTFTSNGQRYMRSKEGVCVALEKINGELLCSIYDIRPELCRSFSQGSEECRSAVVMLKRRP
jgi:Fe-S-cluster containining protein